MENIKKNFYEHHAWENGGTVIGVDEVGRGCLAGPVVAAAVILKPYQNHILLKDSKLLSPKERATVYPWIIKNSIFGLGVVHQRIVDQRNILQATKIAMKKAINHLLITQHGRLPSCIVIDAVNISMPFFKGSIHHFPFGESRSSSIAAASTVAKIHRDALMRSLAQDFPLYDLENNKGYGTPKHRSSLAQQGACLLHRMTFIDHMDASMKQALIPFTLS